MNFFDVYSSDFLINENDSFLNANVFPSYLNAPEDLFMESMFGMNTFDTDIMLLAEFSEVEGPMPIISFPSESMCLVNLNDAVVKLMSVDYQSLSSEFCLHENTQVFQRDFQTGWHSYTHYFTLYDVKARGFVRPMCVTYLSQDFWKMKKCLKKIGNVFLRATEILKVCNLSLFCEELESLIKDLEYTKNKYIEVYETHLEQDINLRVDKQNIGSKSEVERSYKSCESWSVENNSEEEIASLRHTSLDAINLQLLECLHIVTVLKAAMYMERMEAINIFKDVLLTASHSPLYHMLAKLNLLKSRKGKKHSPSIYVMSLMKRGDQSIRNILSLTGLGYVVFLIELYNTYEKFKKPYTVITFEEIDSFCLQNIESTIFVGNIPIVNLRILQSNNMCSNNDISGLYRLALWNSVIVHAVGMFISLDAALPYKDIVSFSGCFNPVEDICLAEDCLEVFGQTDTVFTLKNQEISGQLTVTESIDSEGEEEVVEIKPNAFSRPYKYYDIGSRIKNSQGFRLLALINQFRSIAPSLLYSLLCGKTVILAGPGRLSSIIQKYVVTLSSLIPNSAHESCNILRWHLGTVMPQLVEKYKIIGLCIPERLHVQDLMSNMTLNHVTILNVENGHISGVAYSGSLIPSFDHFKMRIFHSDISLCMHLQVVLLSAGLQVFLFWFLLQTSYKSVKEILKNLSISSSDCNIVQHLALTVLPCVNDIS